MVREFLPILMYHSIQKVPKTEPMRSLHVTPRSFWMQMNLLKILGYRGCSITEALHARNSQSDEKLVALTFDDGYQNFCINALPILQKLGFSATVYVVVNEIGGYNRWDIATGISKNQLMTLEEIHTCIESDIEIGCHTRTHSSLVAQSVDLEDEIKSAKASLEATIDRRVLTFCYPYGHFDTHVAETVARSGYQSATTMIRSRATTTDDPLFLPRVPINWHTLPHLFVLKLLTHYEDKRRHA